MQSSSQGRCGDCRRVTIGIVGYLTRVFRSTEEENRRQILRMLPRNLDGDLLDIGTHDGQFTLRVAQHTGVARPFGVEFLPEHVHRARARGIEVTHADAEQGLPFPDARFALVHANQVIEHMRRTDRFLSELRRVLAPGGCACISTNNLASWHNIVSLALGFQPAPMHVSDDLILGNPLNPEEGLAHEDAGRIHVRVFTTRALIDLCAHHGLRCTAMRTVGYYPFPPRVARVLTRVDRVHGAFLVGLFCRADSMNGDTPATSAEPYGDRAGPARAFGTVARDGAARVQGINPTT